MTFDRMHDLAKRATVGESLESLKSSPQARAVASRLTDRLRSIGAPKTEEEAETEESTAKERAPRHAG
jgi:hypothetical protein